MPTTPPWPSTVIERLLTLYAERKPDKPSKPRWSMVAMAGKLSAMPEADRIFTSNAVVGQCHRLNLEKRVSAFPARKYIKGAVRSPPGEEKPPKPAMPIYTAAMRREARAAKAAAAASDVPPWEDLPANPAPQPPPDPIPATSTPEAFDAEIAEQAETTTWESVTFMMHPSTIHASYPQPDATNVVSIRSTTCQFPIGHPRTKGFRFCGKATWSCDSPGESAIYCEKCYRDTHTMNPFREQARKERQLRRA